MTTQGRAGLAISGCPAHARKLKRFIIRI